MAWGLSEWGASSWGAPAASPATVTPYTTIETIRDKMIDVIEATTPSLFSGHGYRVERSQFDFEDWAENHVNTCLRRFAIEDVSGYELPEISDHIVESLRGQLRLIIAYPKTLPNKLGREGLRDMRDVMRSDMHLIDGRIGHRGGARGNYVSGQHASLATEKSLVNGGDVAFVEILFDVYFYRRAS